MGKILSRNKILLLLLAGGLLLGGCISFLSGPLQEYFRLREELASLPRTQIPQDEMRQESLKLKEEEEAIRQRLSAYGSAHPEALIPAFVRHLETLAREEGLKVAAITPGNPAEAPPLIKIPFQIAISGKFPPLHRFLYRLERSRPPVQIERVVLSRGPEGQLEVTLACSILSWKETPGENPPREAEHLVFQPGVFEGGDQESGGGRDIFAYASYSAPDTGPIRKAPSSEQRPETPGKLRLSAIFNDGPRSMALIEDVPVRTGDTFRGYRVLSIERDRVVLEGAGGMREIFLRKK